MKVHNMIAQFLAANPGFDLQTADLTADAATALGAYVLVGADDQALLQNLRIQQRLQKMYPQPEVAARLQELGYHSAHQIAMGRPSEFVAKAGPQLQDLVAGISGATLAQAVYTAAQRVRNRAWSLALAGPAPTDVSEKLQQPDFQEGLPNYQRLFGPMVACGCEDCESIFSPGAYFVDLMNVVSEYITAPSAATVPAWFALQFRRPDLWNLLIDCQSAHTEVGYLEIVNGVMRQHLSTNFLDGADPIASLASASYPFSAPYNQPLEETSAALAQLGSSLAAIYKALHVAPPAVAQAMLNLSPEQYALVTDPVASMPSLATLYGFHDSTADVEASLAYQALLLERTGMLPQELEAMIYQDFKQSPPTNVISFNGSGYLNAGGVQSADYIGNQTIEFWIYPMGAYPSNRANPLGKSYSGEFSITLNADGSLNCYFGNWTANCNYTGSTSTYMELLTNQSIPLNAWTHVAFVRDLDNLKFSAYFNGQFLNSNTFPADFLPVSTTCPLYIGNGYRGMITGKMAEMRIWKSARSAAQIQEGMYSRPSDAEMSDIASYWPLNEGQGTVAHDLGTNGFDATFSDTTDVTWVAEPWTPFTDSEVVPSLINSLFINQLLGANSYLYLLGQSLTQRQVAQVGIMNDTTAGPLTSTALYQIAQMKRLQQQTGWKWADLDWALKSVAGTSQTITEDIIQMLGRVAGIVQAYDIALDEACALWYDMKTYGRGNDPLPQDLWDRVWNSPPLMANDTSGTQPPYYRPVYAYNPLFDSPVITLDLAAQDPTQTMLLAGMGAALKLHGAELQLLLRHCGALPTILTQDTTFELSVGNMSVLYRYARLAKLLELALPDFLELVGLLGMAVDKWLVTDVVEICETAAWLRQANITVAQLGYLLTGVLPVSAQPVLTAQQLDKAVAAASSASAQARVTADSFVTVKITKAMAETIFAQLVTDGFIDSVGLVLSEVPLTAQNVYTSLTTGSDSSAALFLANPDRQIAQLHNTGSSSCGTIAFDYDPFSDPTIQQDNNFTMAFWMNSAQVLSQTWPEFVGWDQGSNNNDKSPTVTQSQSQRGTVGFMYSPQAGGQRVAAWLDNFFQQDNEWVFVTWVVQAGEWQIYRNGEPFPGVDVVMSTPPYLQQPGLQDYPIGYQFGHILNGALANVSIWNIALDAPAVRSIMLTAPTPGTAGLIGYWPIDEGADAPVVEVNGVATVTIYDHSGAPTPHDGALIGSYAWSAIGHLPAQRDSLFVLKTLEDALRAQNGLVYSGLVGRLGVSAEVVAAACGLTGAEVPLYSYPDFDGEANYVSIPYAATLNNSIFSVALFVMPLGNPDTDRVLVSSLDYSVAGVTKGYQLSLNAQNQVIFTLGSGGSDYNTLASTVTIRANAWSSIVATYDGQTMKLVVNARNYYQYPTTAFAPNATEALYIAAGLDIKEVVSGFFKGRIVQVMVADTNVSRHTFMVDYGKLWDGKTTVPTYLMGWWKLNQQPQGTTVTDASGHDNNGSLEGSIVYTPYPPNELLRQQANSDAAPTDALPAAILQLLNDANPQRPAYLRKLLENVQLAKLFRLNAAELNALQTQPTVFGTNLDFETSNLTLAQLQTLGQFKAMVKAFGDTTNQLLAYFALATGNLGDQAPTDEDLQALLARITGWPLADLVAVMNYFGLAKVATVAALWEIYAVMTISSKTGIGIDGLELIAQLPALDLVSPAEGTNPWQTYLAAAQVAQSAVRSRGQSADADVVGQTQSALRDRLAAWLIWELNAEIRGVANQQDLYEYLLIDVKMSPDVKTSYLVSAMNSLQLYVNRCYNNLEPGTVNEVPAKWWEWMSTYRVWQANREVYLYPENYVDPSLRKFASPQFKNLLNTISKGQVTDANAEQAYAEYLESIRDLASLVMVDAYAIEVPQDLPGTNPDNRTTITYIAGRTQSNPPKYYVRKMLTTTDVAGITTGETAVDESNVQFGPWEELNLAINAQYVSLAHVFGKLFVFWVQQTQKTFTSSQNRQCQAVYGTIYYSYQAVTGNWVPPVTMKSEILLGFDQISWSDFQSMSTGVNFGLLTDFGMWGTNRVIPYFREKAWNKVWLMPLADDSGRLVVQLGAVGMPTGTTLNSAPWTNTNYGPTTVPMEETLWNRTCAAATDLASKFPQADMLISFLPATLLSAGLATQEVPLLIAQNNGTTPLYVFQSAVSRMWNERNIAMIGWFNIAQTSSVNTVGNLCSTWPLTYSSGAITATCAQDVLAGYNGTIVGGTGGVTGISGPTPAWSTIKFLNLTQQNSISIPFNAYYAQKDFTMTMLIRASAVNILQYVVSFLYKDPNGGKQYGWSLMLSGSNQLWLTYGNGSTGLDRSYPTNVTFAADTWYHVGLVVSSNPTLPSFLTINGATYTLNTNTYPSYYAPTGPLNLIVAGATPNFVESGAYNFKGVITNIKYWDTALTGNDVFKDYATSLIPMLSDLPDDATSSQGIANTIGSQMLNLAGQGYLAIANQALPLLQSQVTPSIVNGTLQLTCDEPTTPMDFPLQVKLVRMGTTAVPQMVQALAEGGIDALMQLPMQYLPEQDLGQYYPSTAIEWPASDFMDFNSGFGAYFWELFFYAPFLIAEKLRANQQFAEAERWYKYIFDPTADNHFIDYWPIAQVTPSNAVRDVVGGMVGTAANLAAQPVAKLPFALRERAYYNFNGTNANVIVPYNARLNPPTFSISAWIQFPTTQPSTGGNWRSIMCSQSGSAGYQVSVFFPSAGYWKLISTIYASGWVTLQSPNLPYGDAWQWITVTFDGKVMRSFVNGSEVAQVSLAAGKTFINNSLSAGGNFVIGAGNSATNYTWYFSGCIADMGLWDKALTTGEVANLYADYKFQRLTNRFWNFAPFRRLNAQSLYHILRGDAYESTFVQPPQHYTANLQMAVYEYDPFDPDAIARLRVTSYQKAIFMRYIQNLVAWGDALFTQATWESLTDATMHYVLASDLLGKLPVKEVSTVEQTAVSYQNMVSIYGENKVPSFLIDMEAALASYGASVTIPEQVQSVVNAYFCIPDNAQLLQLWKLVADRLYKLRHGLSLSGQPIDIPLYAPAIDPAALVAAAAAGVNLSVATTTPGVPAYRYTYLIQQAKALASETQQLGSALLAALEKQDAEQLAEMQAGYQVTLTNMSLAVKASQINQLVRTDQSLRASLRSATYARDTYERYLKHGLNAEEIIALVSMGAALFPMAAADGVRIAASIAYLFPNTFGLANGGMQFGESVNMGASMLEGAAQILNAYGQLASTMGQYLRRVDDWTLQKNLANYQMQEVNAQIEANNFAIEAAKQDLAINQAQYSQAQEVLHFLKTKFTNAELYQWMAGQVSGIYFQMYQLAYQMAQLTQVAFQYELNSVQTFLNPGAWNSLYQGLLAGETLMLSLEQMESAYVTNNTRMLHVRKTYSLRQHNPVALLQLLSTGTCHFELDELLYDLDFPGQYNRKLKTLSVSIPAVVGPYQNIHATLVQTHNTVVTKPSVAAVEYLVGQSQEMPLDGSIRSNWNPNQEIVISTGVNDSGVFQVNPDDPQYLPFEGTGAISGWQLTIPQAANTFNLRSISDVILSLEYTAQDGGITYKNALTSTISGLSAYSGLYYISLRQLFSGAWHNFLSTKVLPFELVQQMFPQNLESGSIDLGNDQGDIMLFPILAHDVEGGQDSLPPIMLNGSSNVWDASSYEVAIGQSTDLPVSGVKWQITLGEFPTDPPAPSPLLLPDGKINPAAWLDIALVIPFSGSLDW